MKAESLAELFNTAPDILTDEQVDKIVAAIQQDRERFLIKEAELKEPKKKKVAADLNLKIEDLDL